MALYIWSCRSCKKITKKLLNTRPALSACDCGGVNEFNTAPSTSVREVIDNGLMVRSLERDPNIEQLLQERNEIADKEQK